MTVFIVIALAAALISVGIQAANENYSAAGWAFIAALWIASALVGRLT